MFNATFQSISSSADNFINSSAVDCITTDAIKGMVTVMYNDSSVYQYKNVSRRSIAKFNIDDARSMGKFVNTVLKRDGVITTLIAK